MSGLRFGGIDLNGLMRGKRMPLAALDKVRAEGARLPLSALNVDLWGADIEGSPLVFESGDADGTLRAVVDAPLPMPWLQGEAQLLPMALYLDDGTPFAGDPIHALAGVLAGYAAQGLTVIAATELEFYLLDASTADILPALVPGTPHRLAGEDVLSLHTLDAFDAFFTDLYAGAEAMGLPAAAAISESGAGQFEVNLTHAEAMATAQATWAFKMLTKGVARNHGLTATFAPKPFADQAGNGLHVHFSVVDAAGRNIFDNGGPEGSAALHHALAGCLNALPESTLILAPHAQSYDRFAPGSHAPTGVAWGYENRTTALRVPGGPPAARRIEHRVAGGDANPYLMLASVLAAAQRGLTQGMLPPPPLQGSAYDQDLPQLPTTWDGAVQACAPSNLLPPQLIDNLCRTKRQEHAKSATTLPETLRRLMVDLL